MPRRKHAVRVTALLLCVLGLAVLAGCGGGGNASSSTPVDQLLRETFSGHKQVTSGKLSISLKVNPKGTSQVQGPLDVQISGPFESRGAGKFPEFDMQASLQGGGQSIDAGMVSTGDKGYVRFQGSDYAISDQVFRQLVKGYEQAQSQARSHSGSGRSLASLGIDPRSWLTNARNAGEAKVGDADTIEITGGVNVPKLLDDVNTLLARTRSLGGSAAQGLPQQLTPQERRQAAKAVKHVSVRLYTGKDDKILRRLAIALSIVGPQGSSAAGQSADLLLDVQLTEVNQGQSISAPSNAKPFSQLLNMLGGLGLGATSSGGAASGGSSAGAGNLQKYSRCIEKAGSDAAKARKCANLLTP